MLHLPSSSAQCHFFELTGWSIHLLLRHTWLTDWRENTQWALLCDGYEDGAFDGSKAQITNSHTRMKCCWTSHPSTYKSTSALCQQKGCYKSRLNPFAKYLLGSGPISADLCDSSFASSLPYTASLNDIPNDQFLKVKKIEMKCR